MKAFEGKVLKLYLNSSSGYVVASGNYIDEQGDFIIIENSLSKKIQYFCKYHIKYIEILKEVEVDEDELDN